MKKLLFSFALLLLGSAAVMAQPRRFKLQEPEYYDLTLGKVSMRIDAANGARITSLRYDTLEVLSQINAPNMYGSTFWTSPQKEWNWPPVQEHDIMGYKVERTPDAIVMTSQLSSKLPIRITKTFAVDKAANDFVISYTMTNESDAERKVAPWEITRVPAEGTVFFDAPLNAITPAGLMNFKEKGGLVWYDIDQAERQRKINADGKGWLGYINNGLLLLKTFADLTPSQPAPDEAEIQVYVHQGKVYVEIESQGAYVNLKPGESTTWTVRWSLTKAG